MNEFEDQLKSRSLRQIPEQWRTEILRAAQNEAQATASNASVEEVTSWWRALLWPCPQAWAGMAAVWIVVFCLNFSSQEPSAPKLAKTKPAPISPETYMALREQRRLYSELVGSPPVEIAMPVPRPRAEMKIETVIV
jgi:hypothetical protein